MSGSARRRWVWGLALVMATTAAVSMLGMGGEAALAALQPDGTRRPVLGLVVVSVAFLTTELLVVHLRVRDDAHTTSLAELPMALALLFASPLVCVAGRTIGTALALLPGLRRSALKYVFNLGLLSLTSVLSVVLHRTFLGAAADPAGLRGWVSLAAALALSHTVTSVMVGVAVLLTSPHLRVLPMLRVSAFGIGVTLTLSVVGIFLAVATWHEPALLVLDVAAVLGIYQLLRVYARITSQHETLQRLYEYSRQLGAESSIAGGARISLLEGVGLLGASRGDLYVPWAGDQVHWQVRDGHVAWVDTPRADLASIAALAGRGPEVFTNLPNGPAAEALRRLGHDGVALAPLRGHDAIGWIAFGLGAPGGASGHERDLVASIAQQAASALSRSELVDRLRAEADERERQALHDALTGLPNRSYFMQRLNNLVASRPVGDEIAVMVIDLDRFKEVNDSLGHQYGDHLLREVGARLRHDLRATEFVARLGGDEFGVLVAGPDAAATATALADRLAGLLREPIGIADTTVAVGGSVGVSLCPRHADNADTLLRQADIAMYAAKRDDLPFVVYQAETEESWLRRLQVAGRLRASDLLEAIDVWYQPQIDLRTGTITGAEALARWTDSELGQVSPAEFVPVAEQAGLARDLSLSVLRQAIPAAASWRRAGHPVRLSVNLSGPALLDPEVVRAVRESLRESRLPPEALLVEVTESVFVSDSLRLNEVLLAYEDLGVSLSIDDFGTGYSSLSYLRRLPADELKIDRSFVDGMTHDPSKLAIVRSTVALAHELGMHAVAEGIEDDATVTELVTIGCDVGQGFHLGRPMPLLDFRDWLATHRPPERRPDVAGVQSARSRAPVESR